MQCKKNTEIKETLIIFQMDDRFPYPFTFMLQVHIWFDTIRLPSNFKHQMKMKPCWYTLPHNLMREQLDVDKTYIYIQSSVLWGVYFFFCSQHHPKPNLISKLIASICIIIQFDPCCTLRIHYSTVFDELLIVYLLLCLYRSHS